MTLDARISKRQSFIDRKYNIWVKRSFANEELAKLVLFIPRKVKELQWNYY